MYYTYILISKNCQKTYTGCTKNIKQRIEEHNGGKVKSSRPYIPYEFLYIEELESFKDARTRERYYKSTSGRREIKRLIDRR